MNRLLKGLQVNGRQGSLVPTIVVGVPVLGPLLVSDLRRADCRALVATCRLKGLKVTTIAGIARTLSTILMQAVSLSGSAPDEANARKAYNRIFDAAGLHRRGPHQMRHTFDSLLLQQGAPIT